MNWYLFALLIVFGMIICTACKIAIDERKSKLTIEAVKKICEETIGRSMQTMEDVTKELIDYSMQKTQEAVKNTFNMEDES